MKSKKIKLAVTEAIGLWEKGIGLINKKPMAILLRTRFGIHTFGMKYPIDVVVLDEKNTVVKIRKALRPNKFFVWNPKFPVVVELPEGSVHKYAIMLNDTIVPQL
jgi:uncharacterized membrane protein (UPF0127 family)